MAASLYGAYSHMEASGKSQNTSTARTQARALAQDALAASAAYFNQLFCGSTSSTCASGNAENLSATAIPAGMVLLDQTTGTNTMTAQVVSNTFATNGDIEIDATGQTASGLAQIRAYLHAATIYSFTPLQYAFLINGSQVLTGNVSINTGTNSLTVVGNLGIQGSASITGAAQATGLITDSTGKSCGSTATCTQNISQSSVVSPTINAYNLSSEANAVFSVNASGEPQVTFENDAALVPAGTTLLSAFPSSSTSLCVAGGASCISGPSPTDPNGAWAITSTPTPGVLFFYGDLSVASGAIGNAQSGTAGYATLITTGNALVATLNNIVSYGQMLNVCNHTVIPTNVCPNGATTANNGEGTGAVANAVLISGGSVDYSYAGGSTVYDNGKATNAVPIVGDTTETAASDPTQPSGTVTGLFCSGVGSAGACISPTPTTGVITGGDVTLQGNGSLTGVVAAGESLTAKGDGTITGMIDTANANNLSTSTLGGKNNASLNSIKGNLKIDYAPGVSNATNFGGGGQTPEMAFMPVWQRYY